MHDHIEVMIQLRMTRAL